jgi:hypothetical protein
MLVTGGKNDPNRMVKLNVGGKVFVTTMATLACESGSVLAAMFLSTEEAERGRLVSGPAKTDDDGAFFIDRSPDAFAAILEFLRTNR